MPRTPLHSASRVDNLPSQVTPFIGREQEAAAIQDLLLGQDIRLLTLTGPPGIGKTRLSLDVAARLTDHYPDGVWFVPLAPVTNPLLAASSIAQVLDLKQTGSRPIAESLADYLRERRLLLVLDNFEQIIQAAPLVVDLLSAAPKLKCLVTSREALRVSGEQEFAVPPLSLPRLDKLPTAADIKSSESVQLFTQRARFANVDFTLTDQNAPVVAAICWRLDGLPLAIELAAARTKLLPPQALFERLGLRLNLLTGGARDLPPRHRTLRNAIDWSYNLLDETERRLFRRLGVFKGGCTLEAIESVCNTDQSIATGTLDAVAALVDKSLMQQVRLDVTGDVRLMMLETVKEYAFEQLSESGEAEDIARSHALYFLNLAEMSVDKLGGPEGEQWLQNLEKELDNFRAALQWARTEALEKHREAGVGLRLAAALGHFWYIRGYLSEGRYWIMAMLSLPGADEPLIRARALHRLGFITYAQSDYGVTRSHFEESLKISREIGNLNGIAAALEGLGEVATEQGDYVTAPLRFNESLAITRKLGDKLALASLLNNLGYMALRTGDCTSASKPFEEALSLFEEMGFLRGVAFTTTGLGEVALRSGDYEQALDWHQKSLEARQRIGDRWGVAISLASLGWVAMLQADYARATDLFTQSVSGRRDIGDLGGVAWCLEKMAGMAHEQQQTERAVRLLGAAKSLRDKVGSVIDPSDQPEHERNLAAMRATLGDNAFTLAWTTGSEMSMDEAVTYAIDLHSQQHSLPSHKKPATSNRCSDLTRRECEIAALIATSKSNTEIAEALVLSKRTVETHINHILSKLDFTSRGQIAAWAIKRGLIQSDD